ncbi:dipeptidase PepV [Alkalihalobacillus sp. MEB130]|uniref:dipeptidase PepV n=1 Tax=Alkalihalobacillus sp. MEB130 TaxID=2976704 RepID=UPI0028DDF3D0|nr:dipeptidase PepV [Alkalihalobacillus sp. MEB130]MDT8859336.1 dipeptidase PepV [Alkalihalobacillus sp. MEB130]
MTTINWMHEVEKRKENLIKETQQLLQIASVLDDSTIAEGSPFGEGIAEALQYLLQKGEENQFFVKNLDGYAGVIEYGSGEESVGILCHLDVVPAGNGWTSPPFSAEIRDERIYARGAIDNKGPTMAAFFALLIVKELGLTIDKRVRMILGTDEESNWRCVEHYFKHEEMPTVGFAPDADFPIIHAEKGITDVSFNWESNEEEPATDVALSSFSAGERFNMVPDQAHAIIRGDSSIFHNMETDFKQFLANNQHNGEAKVEQDELHLTYYGISAHGSTPENGLNAGTSLAQFLAKWTFQKSANAFLSFIQTYCDFDGTGLKIAVSDQASGPLTMNAGLLKFQEKKEAKVGLNIRYPVTASAEECLNQLKRVANSQHATFTIHDHMGPNYVEENHPLIKTLQQVYQRQTGEEANLLAIGGGTYARSLKTGVAFGPMFPGREDVAHKKDEYIAIDDLMKMTAIYAEAIYELAKA